MAFAPAKCYWDSHFTSSSHQLFPSSFPQKPVPTFPTKPKLPTHKNTAPQKIKHYKPSRMAEPGVRGGPT